MVDQGSMAPQGRARMPKLAVLRELFARGDQRYHGADIETARKLVGMLWGFSAALAAVFLVLAPPDISLGDAGWPSAILIVALSIGGMVGCGNDGRKMPINPVQPTNYTITLTATSGGVSHSTALTLTVQ